MAVEPDIDMVSDLNGSGDTNVSVHETGVPAHGTDAVRVDRVEQPKITKVAPEPNAGDTASEKPKSLRDQISSVLKGETETPAIASPDGKIRNPDGTFAPKPAATTAAPLVDPNASAPVAAPQGIDPQVFKSLPAETQASLARTMEDIGQRQTRFARLEQVEQVLAPRREAWALNGMTEPQALGQMLALSDFANRDLPGFIKYIAEQGKVDLTDLVLAQEPVDPKYAALEKQVAELRSGEVQRTQQQRQAAHEQTVNSVLTFAEEKGQDGQLLRPYFSQLGNDINPFISAVKAQNSNWTNTQVLQEAYDRACWGTPSVRAKMQEATQAVADAQRLRQGTEKADRARAASTSVANGVPTAAPKSPNDPGTSLRDSIRASIAAAAG